MASEVVCTFDRKGAKVPLKILSCFVHPGLAAHPAGPIPDASVSRGPVMAAEPDGDQGPGGGGAPTGGAS
jgi:hypothetical protein